MEIPQTMKAIFQDKANGKLYTQEVPIPTIKRGQVLVKMHAAPINPSDLSMLQGTYAHKPEYPYVPGLEGSGFVVASGGGIMSRLRNGKFVALSAEQGEKGTWAEYVATSATNCIPVKKNVNKKLASMIIVNPLTVLSFMQIISRKKSNAIISTAAGSALGRMLQYTCNKANVSVINIVRREIQVEKLKQAGYSYVLNSESDNFISQLQELVHVLSASLVFDAVGGTLAEQIIDVLPAKSIFYSYAMLSETNFRVNPRILIQKEIEITGFYLSHFLKKQTMLTVLAMTKQAQNLVSSHAQPKIQKIYSIAAAQEAIDFYRENMSEGKVLFAF